MEAAERASDRARGAFAYEIRQRARALRLASPRRKVKAFVKGVAECVWSLSGTIDVVCVCVLYLLLRTARIICAHLYLDVNHASYARAINVQKQIRTNVRRVYVYTHATR